MSRSGAPLCSIWFCSSSQVLEMMPGVCLMQSRVRYFLVNNTPTALALLHSNINATKAWVRHSPAYSTHNTFPTKAVRSVYVPGNGVGLASQCATLVSPQGLLFVTLHSTLHSSHPCHPTLPCLPYHSALFQSLSTHIHSGRILRYNLMLQ